MYNISLSGPDSFTKVNHEVAQYVACTIPCTGEFCTAMINMQLDPLAEPEFLPDPDDTDFAQLVEIWREDHKLFVKQQEEHQKVITQIFPIVLGQYAPAMHAHMEANANLDAINDGYNVIGMLQLIRTVKYSDRLIVTRTLP